MKHAVLKMNRNESKRIEIKLNRAQVVQKLCVEKKWIPFGLSIDFLRYHV